MKKKILPYRKNFILFGIEIINKVYKKIKWQDNFKIPNFKFFFVKKNMQLILFNFEKNFKKTKDNFFNFWLI